jgi:hypothetical protein
VQGATGAAEQIFCVEEGGVGGGAGVELDDCAEFGVDFVDAGYVGLGKGLGSEEVIVEAVNQVGYCRVAER